MKFEPKGPKRYAHQIRGLKKMIETGGITALLFDPGTGKTMTTLDFMSILAQKVPAVGDVQECRVLVIAPLAAVDTWVIQAEMFVSDQVNVWAEVLGGSITERAEALSARAGDPMAVGMVKRALLDLDMDDAKQRRLGLQRAVKIVNQLGITDTGPLVRALARKLGMKQVDIEKAILKGAAKPQTTAPKALHTRKAVAWFARGDESRRVPISQSEGPDGLGTEKPRLIIEVLNFDTFSSRMRVGTGTMADLLLEAVKRYKPDLVVIDEMHKIKGSGSNLSRLIARIGDTVKRRVGLTGTVMPAGPLDVFAQWRFIEPYAFGHVDLDGSRSRATAGDFQERFGVMGGYMGRQVVGYRNLDEMQQIMARNAVVVKKEDALDLPPTMDVVIPVHLTPQEQMAYDTMKKSMHVDFGGGIEANAESVLTQALRLEQITSGHLPDDLGNIRVLGHSKVNVINSIVNDKLAQETRVVVACQYTHEIHALAEKMKSPDTIIMVASGENSQDDRIKYRKLFGSNDPRRMILIVQIQTMSLAVNELVTASHLVFGSMSRKRDEYIQMRDRLDRIGQTKPVTFWHALVPHSVDEVIMKSHRDRTNLETAMLQHIKDEEAVG